MKKNILIISNDRLNIQGDKISSDYNDAVNIIESLSEKNHLDFLCRLENGFKNFISQKMKTLARAESYFTSTPRDNFMVFNKGLVGVVYSR